LNLARTGREIAQSLLDQAASWNMVNDVDD